MSYAETLPLLDKEVVLTFDDGPISPYTERVLDILASECVRATFFIVGRMAKVHPELIRRAAAEGHTIGTHTMNHPLRFKALDEQRARQEIDDGIEAVTAALGDPSKLAPFFRFPGFGRTEAAEEHLASRHLMVWGADFPADDWRRIGPGEVARRALSRLEAKGRGILLLHDIHERTVEALPIIFEQLKERGFRIVHVVPTSENIPATETTAEAWHPKWTTKGLSSEVTGTAEIEGERAPASDSAKALPGNPLMEHTAAGTNHKRSRFAHRSSRKALTPLRGEQLRRPG